MVSSPPGLPLSTEDEEARRASRGDGSNGHEDKGVASVAVHGCLSLFGSDCGSNNNSNINVIDVDTERNNDLPRGNGGNQKGGRGRTGGCGRGGNGAAMKTISAAGGGVVCGRVGKGRLGLGGGPGMKSETVVGRAVDGGDGSKARAAKSTGVIVIGEGDVRVGSAAIEVEGVEGEAEKEAMSASLGRENQVMASGGRARKRAAPRRQVGDHRKKGRSARRGIQKGMSKSGTGRVGSGKTIRRDNAAEKRAIASRNEAVSLGQDANEKELSVLAEDSEDQGQDRVVKRPQKRRCVREGGGAGDNGPGSKPSDGSSSADKLARETVGGAYSAQRVAMTMAPRIGHSKHCRFSSCHRSPSYGIEDEKRAAFCSQHRLSGMVNVVSPRCLREGCRRGPSYNDPSEKKPVFCAGHRMSGMINVVSPRCHHLSCTRGPSYGHDGDRKATFCSGHRLLGMVNVVSPRCVENGCMKGPSYGFEGRRASLCAKHKRDGMLNVVSPRCLELSCIRGPSYALPGDRKPLFCAKHKQDKMINVMTRKCSVPDCGRGPSFGNDEDRRASFCELHRLDGMVQITSHIKY